MAELFERDREQVVGLSVGLIRVGRLKSELGRRDCLAAFPGLERAKQQLVRSPRAFSVATVCAVSSTRAMTASRAPTSELFPTANPAKFMSAFPSNTKLQIEHNKETGTFIYRSIDPETGEVVRQWPPEQLLELREHLAEMEGLLLDKEV